MRFHEFKEQLASHFAAAVGNGYLYETDADKDKLWEIYLSSFPNGSNPIYRVRTEHDCSCCRHFIKEIGRTVTIDRNLNVHSIFDFEVEDANYQAVLDAMRDYVQSCAIVGEYLSPIATVGTPRTQERSESGAIITFEHYSLALPVRLVHRSNRTIDTDKGQFRDTRNVFKRSLTEITVEAIETVLELIRSNTLYKGAEWEKQINDLLNCKREFDSLTDAKRETYCWAKAGEVGPVLGRIRNHSIGKLLTDISEGVDLDAAVRAYELIVAPANYKRPKAIYTQKMLEEAQKTVVEMGYMDSLARRYATLDDITVNNILFSNRDSAKRIGGSVFDEMKSSIPFDPKRFNRSEEIGIEKFVADVLPTATEVEAFVENRHTPNLVSLIAPVNRDAKSMFKWDNGFSWAYAGNMTDSDIRENVKNAGGRVDGVLRFSIQWNDEIEWNRNDLDAHCREPDGYEIFYMRKLDESTGGNLDVDIINPQKGVPAVENITFPAKNKMQPGQYKFFVHCFSNRGGSDGFKAEIEFDGQIYRFEYRKPIRQNENVLVATVLLEENGELRMVEALPSSDVSGREIWNVKTHTFTPVSVVMHSPNYWDNQQGIGHKHYFFMLKGCVNPENPNGFYNEFLRQELVEHKRVFEALGSRMAVAPSDDQLSGIGFSSTKRNDLIVKVRGNSGMERIMKIKF